MNKTQSLVVRQSKAYIHFKILLLISDLEAEVLRGLYNSNT